MKLFGHEVREGWLAKDINGTTWPSAVPNGQKATLTNCVAGTGKATTTDGVHFIPGVNTSNMTFTDPYDAVNDWWASMWIKLDADFSSASSTNQNLLGKKDGANDYLTVYLSASDGKLYMSHNEASDLEFVRSTQVAWVGGQWYHILASCSTTNGKRLRIDGGTADAEAAQQNAISLTANMSIGALDDGTDTEGFAGVIRDVIMDNVALSAANEALLAKGINVTTPLNIFLCDEGRGVTITDRGAGADDATLDSSCYWDWGSGVRQSCFSKDGVNDYAVSAAGVDISGATTLVWVGRMKSTHVTLAASTTFVELYIDANSSLRFFVDTASNLSYYAEGSNAPKTLTIASTHSIGDLMILTGTVNAAGAAAFYRNGVSGDTDTAVGDRSGSPATAYIGAINTPANYGVSDDLAIVLLNGELTAGEVLQLHIDINEWLGLGISI